MNVYITDLKQQFSYGTLNSEDKIPSKINTETASFGLKKMFKIQSNC